MKLTGTLVACLAFTGCAAGTRPDAGGLVGLTAQHASEALRARGLDHVSRVEPPPGAKRPPYLYAEHRDLVGWPCPARQWVAVHFDLEGGRATRVESGVATDCAWP